MEEEKRELSIHRFYSRYREIILFNKNIIIAAIVSLITDGIVVQYAATSIGSNNNSIAVSFISIVTDSSAYLASFAMLFYIDNRSKYYVASSYAGRKKDSARLRRDVKKIVAALGVSEVAYMAVKFTSIYMLLQGSEAPPYQLAVSTTLLAWVFYIVAANVMIKMQKLFGR